MDKVLVGLPGPWANDYAEPADHFTSKIGGLPDWPFPVEDLQSGLLECGACGSSLALVSQVYAPVHAAGMRIEERTIYVFGCVKLECGGTHLSWRALRVQRILDGNVHDATVQADDPKSNVSGPTISFLDDENDNDDLSLEELSKAFKNLATSISDSSKENTKKQEKIINTSVKDSPLNVQPRVVLSSASVLPCFYLYAQEESSATLNKSKPLPPIENQINITDHDTETWDNENYEYGRALSADRTYLKYKKVIDCCPEQCFRYKYGGNPLLASKSMQNPTPCQHCGAPRHYEMQLMPPLVYFLHEGAKKHPKYSPDNWNWMTLIIYTCTKNCSVLRSEGSHSWAVAAEEIELQLEETQAIFSPLLAADHLPAA